MFFQNLNHQTRSILWVVHASFWFAVMIVLVRYLSETLHPFEIVFFRNAFALLLFVPGIVRHGVGHIHSKAKKLHVFRGCTGVVGMLMWFYALSITPVSQATALSFVVPLITTLMAIIFLKEKVGIHRWLALLIGFSGVLVILRPGFEAVSFGSILVLATTCSWSVSNILIKRLTATEPPRVIAFYLTLFMTPISLPFALSVWHMPEVSTLLWLLLLALAANLAQISLAHAYTRVDISSLMPFDFTRLILVSVFAWVLFGEVIDPLTIVGAIVIVASSVYVARREALLRRKAK